MNKLQRSWLWRSQDGKKKTDECGVLEGKGKKVFSISGRSSHLSSSAD